jgi:hypothetical protein
MFYQPPSAPEILGSKVDQLMQAQEENAEAAKFIVYQHEFQLNFEHDARKVRGIRLNEYGEDHLKRIAQSIRGGAPYPVIVERSQTTIRPETEFKYPIHYNPDLDMQRREVVIRALNKMGIPDADSRVVVSSSFAQPLTGVEAEQAYYSTFNNWGGGGWGGGGGGWGGGGW